MPIHDWTRVSAGIFHHFHHSWIEEIMDALNKGVLPSDYYALSEQSAGDIGPDILTLKAANPNGAPERLDGGGNGNGTLAVAVAPPHVRFVAQAEAEHYARKQSRLSIRHVSDDDAVAFVEIVSPGNKDSRARFRKFVDKATGILMEGRHLLVLDLLPPGVRDPRGMHGAIWEDLAGPVYEPPAEKPFTLAAYDAGPPITAYVEPIAIRDTLPPMPLFLQPEHYVNVPLGATYEKAFDKVPARWRNVLES